MRSFTPIAAFCALLFVTGGSTLAVARRAPALAPHQELVYVGAYTKGTSKGIYAYHLNEATGQMTSLGLAAATVNPSYVIIDRTGRFLYAVNETDSYKGQKSGAISAFAIHPETGKLTFLNQVASKGEAPCYLSIDKTGKYLMVANYDSGNIAVFPLESDGKIGPASDFIQHHGSGINKARQEGPHAHFIAPSPDNRFVLSADLGLDKLFVYRLNAATGKLTANQPPYAAVHPGLGPRHVAFSRDHRFVYLIDEMGSEIIVYSWDGVKGRLQPVQEFSTIGSFKGENTGAEIEVSPSGRFLYASNRGENDIVVYTVNRATGHLTELQRISTEGNTPRQFAISPDGRFLFVGNQNGGNVVGFRIDRATGKLTPTGQQLQLDTPVCVTFMPEK